MADNEIAIKVIGCLIEMLANDEGNIDLKCFEKIFNACVKSLLEGAQVGDQAVALLKSFAGQVAFLRILGICSVRNMFGVSNQIKWEPADVFITDFKTTLLAKSQNAFPLVNTQRPIVQKSSSPDVDRCEWHRLPRHFSDSSVCR
jgi:hypothetical protein